MRNTIITALAFCAMATTGAMAADANNATESDCAAMQVKVHSALDANQSSSNLADAKKENSLGHQFCGNSLPKVGVAHYAQALKLLGVSAS